MVHFLKMGVYLYIVQIEVGGTQNYGKHLPKRAPVAKIHYLKLQYLKASRVLF